MPILNWWRNWNAPKLEPAAPPPQTEKNPGTSKIIENLFEGVAILDPAGKITDVNNSFCRLFQLDREAARGKPLLEVLRHPPLETLRQKAVAQAAALFEEVKLFAPEERSFDAQFVPLKENGRLTGMILVLYETTRLRQLENIRQELVANVSHELRTPLTSIKGFAETLLDGAVDDKEHRLEFLSSIVKQCDRLTSLVGDLLTLSSLESEKNKPVKEKVSLPAVVSEVFAGLKHLARDKKVSLRSKLSPDLAMVETDKRYLHHILTNLVTNAIQYNVENGWVEISSEIQGQTLKISVSDSGIGIPAPDLPRLFERFYRVDQDRSREKGGTGLGLSIVKHTVESLGGQVGVESKLAEGSVFWFTLNL